MRNYRSISLLSVVSKVLESLVNGIVDFVTNSISVHQFGFFLLVDVKAIELSN